MKKRKHQRRVRIGLVLPASVELVVGTDDPDDGDWEILSVVSANCQASVRTVEESMQDVDCEALAEAAERAEDEP